jgi:hypothetical protein
MVLTGHRSKNLELRSCLPAAICMSPAVSLELLCRGPESSVNVHSMRDITACLVSVWPTGRPQLHVTLPTWLDRRL